MKTFIKTAMAGAFAVAMLSSPAFAWDDHRYDHRWDDHRYDRRWDEHRHWHDQPIVYHPAAVYYSPATTVSYVSGDSGSDSGSAPALLNFTWNSGN